MGPGVIVEVVEKLRGTYSISELCYLLGIPKSTYYRWKQRDWTHKDKVEQAVIELCLRHKRRYGYRRITAALCRILKRRVNHKKVLRLMRKNHLLSKIRKRKTVFLSGQESVVVNDKIKRNFKASAPNQKWFTDVSYLPFGKQMLYFSSIIDSYNNEVISYKVSHRQDIQLVLQTLEEACKDRNVNGIVLHSDQGGLYTSRRFQQYAKEKGIITSMSRKGNCHDNAAIESFHSHFKSEAFYAQNIKNTSNSIVLKIVNDYMHYYNHERIQEKLNYLSPVDYRQQVS